MGQETANDGSRQRRITPDEHDQIVTETLDGLSHRVIAANLGCDKDTVAQHWALHLKEQAAAISDHLEAHQTEVTERLKHAAHRARCGAGRAAVAGDWTAEGMFIRTELRALQQLARIMGMEKFTLTGPVESIRLPTQEEARAARAKHPKNK